MNCSFIAFLRWRQCAQVCAGLLLWFSVSAQANGGSGEAILFPSAFEPGLTLSARYFAATAPVKGSAVLLHGCAGAYRRNGSVDERLINLAKLLGEMGLQSLVVDSFGPRGIAEICTQRPSERPINANGRVPDAFAALAWLREREPAAGRVSVLLGLSHGAMTALQALDARRAAQFAPLAFDGVVMFYPGCADVLARRPAFVPAAPGLLLLGLADDWTNPAPCLALGQLHANDAPPLKAVGFEGAYHAFDSPNPVTVRTDVTHGMNGRAGVHIGANPAAREAAYAELRRFVHARLAASAAH